MVDQTITTQNSTTVSSLLPSPPAASAAPVYSLALNRATERLTRGVRRLYNRSSLKLAGTLRDSAGVATPGVEVSVWAQPAPGGDFAELAHTTTDGAGTWTLTVPRGSSRLLRVVAGAKARASGATDAVTVRETVTPVLSLHVTTPGGGRIVFSGRLAIGPLGAPRPLVFIQTRGPDGWEVVGSPVRVNRQGKFTYVYRSSPVTEGRQFAFRAETPATGLWDTALSPTREALVR